MVIVELEPFWQRVGHGLISVLRRAIWRWDNRLLPCQIIIHQQFVMQRSTYDTIYDTISI
jgi:hypothetical protein